MNNVFFFNFHIVSISFSFLNSFDFWFIFIPNFGFLSCCCPILCPILYSLSIGIQTRRNLLEFSNTVSNTFLPHQVIAFFNYQHIYLIFSFNCSIWDAVKRNPILPSIISKPRVVYLGLPYTLIFDFIKFLFSFNRFNQFSVS